MENILDKIKDGEGLKIEFKESVSSLPKDFYETAVSFSNTDGGTIFLGVKDSGEVIGVNPESVKQIIADLVTSLNNSNLTNPSIYVNPTTVEVAGKNIIVVQIQSSSTVHTYKSKTYIRSGDADIDISKNKSKIDALIFEKSNKFTESTIYPYLSMDDLDSNLFDKARTLIRNYKSDHPWLLVDDEQMLRESSLWRKDFRTGEQGLTLAAALIFGKDITIQNLLPTYKVEAMVRIKNTDRYDDRITKRTNLIDTYLSLKEFINRYLPDRFYTEGDQRIDLRDKIFREVIGNVIVHREYTNPLSTDMIIYKNDVVFTNPNKPIFHGVLDPDKFNPYPKNPNIRKFFTAFGWTDEIGSGVRNTNKYLPLYANGAKPIFTEDQTFKTEIPLFLATLEDSFSKWTSWIDLPIDKSEHLRKALSNIPIALKYVQLEWNEMLPEMLSSWNKKAINLPHLEWVENNAFTKENNEKLSTSTEKAINLLKKRTWYYIVILSLCGEAISLKEILEAIDYKDRIGFTKKYVLPLRQAGLISYINEEKPNDVNNKLLITTNGKDFLAG